VHFLCLEPRETDKSVLKFSKNLVLKFHFLLLGALYTSVIMLVNNRELKHRTNNLAIIFPREMFTILLT